MLDVNSKTFPSGNSFNVELGGRLRDIRKGAGLSQIELSAALNEQYKQSAISAVERGDVWITAQHISAWCQGAGKDPFEVMSGWGGETQRSPSESGSSSGLPAFGAEAVLVAKAWERGDIPFILSMCSGRFSEMFRQTREE